MEKWLKSLTPFEVTLTEVTIENTPKLISINLMNNLLSTIDLSAFRDLKYFSADRNKLEEIDFTNNPELVQFNILKNNIKIVDITKNPNLNMKILYLDDNVQIIGTEYPFPKS